MDTNQHLDSKSQKLKDMGGFVVQATKATQFVKAWVFWWQHPKMKGRRVKMGVFWVLNVKIVWS